jgi:hypothetical protein
MARRSPPRKVRYFEPPAIDAHRAAETPADLEGGFDDSVAGEARSDRLDPGTVICPDAGEWRTPHCCRDGLATRAS